MYKENSSNLRRMKLLDIEKVIYNYEAGIDSSLGQSTYENLKVQLEKIIKIVGDEF